MSTPRVALITICLNEMEWLPYLYQQHKDWPGLVKWAFVEGVDPAYQEANPTMVNDKWLSVDGTSKFLQELKDKDPRVSYVPYGYTSPTTKDTGKIELKQTALEQVESLRPDVVIAIDADEFYPLPFQEHIPAIMQCYPDHQAFIFNRREIWRPPSIVDRPLFDLEITGGFWGMPCSHWWNWKEGMGFRDCHNTPSNSDGSTFNNTIKDLRSMFHSPYMIHMGFASKAKNRLAKNTYYAIRGESTDRYRKWYVESRDRWRLWRPGMILPRDARVTPYTGRIPECFSGVAT